MLPLVTSGNETVCTLAQTEHAGEEAKVNFWEAPTEVSRWKEEHVSVIYNCGFLHPQICLCRHALLRLSR